MTNRTQRTKSRRVLGWIGAVALGWSIVFSGRLPESATAQTPTAGRVEISLSFGGERATRARVDEAAGHAVIEFYREPLQDGPVTLEYVAEQASNAEAGVDFVAVRGTAKLPSGQSDGRIEIPIVDDGRVEPDEYFRLQITEITNGGRRELGPFWIAIVDNEMPASIDEDFNPDLPREITAVAVLSGSRTLVAYRNAEGKSELARLSSDGSHDPAFRKFVTESEIGGIWPLPDGGVLLRMWVDEMGSVSWLRRLRGDGSVDESFARVPEYPDLLAVQPDGSIVTLDPEQRGRLRRLTPNGVPDSSFASADLGAVATRDHTEIRQIEALRDGSLLLIVSRIPDGVSWDVIPEYLLKLDRDGRLDSGFVFSPLFIRGRIVPSPSGDPYLHGWNLLNTDLTAGPPGPFLYRIRSDGSVDPGFVLDLGIRPPADWFAEGRSFRPSAVDAEGRLVGFAGGGSLVRLTRDGSLDGAVPIAARVHREYDWGESTPDSIVYGSPDGALLMARGTRWVLRGVNGDSRSFVRIHPDRARRTSFRLERPIPNGPDIPYPGGDRTLAVKEAGGAPSGVIRRLGDTRESATVRLRSKSGSGSEGVDFEQLDRTIEFESLQVTKNLPGFRAVPDLRSEPDETLTLELTGQDGRGFGSEGRITITLLDDDRPGSEDTSFHVITATRVAAVLPDGGVLISRDESSIERTLSTGETDTSWIAERFEIVPFSNDNELHVLRLEADGRIYRGGKFRKSWSEGLQHLVRHEPGGKLDTNFVPNFGAAEPWWPVTELAARTDGLVYIAIRRLWNPSNGGYDYRVIRLLSNGSTDPTFAPARVSAERLTGLVSTDQGGVWIVGDLTSVNDVPTRLLARLDGAGAVDESFASLAITTNLASRFAYRVLRLADGGYVVGGRFQFQGESRPRSLLRFSGDGRFDERFQVESDGWELELAEQADGKLLIAGPFRTVNGQVRKGLARLHPDGSLDASFDPGDQAPRQPGTDGPPRQVFSGPDGSVFVVYGNYQDKTVRLYKGDRRAALLPLPLVAGEFRAELIRYGPHPVVIEASPSLDPPAWKPVRTIAISGDSDPFRDPIGPGLRGMFYRAVVPKDPVRSLQSGE